MKRIVALAILIACAIPFVSAAPALAVCSQQGTAVSGANGHTHLLATADWCTVSFSSTTSANHGWYLSRKWHVKWQTKPGPRGFYRVYRTVNAKFRKTGTTRWDLLTVTQWIRVHV